MAFHPGSASAAVHHMICETETPAEALLRCADEACGRTVVVGKSEPGLTVIRRGDFHARHVGSIGAIGMAEPRIA